LNARITGPPEVWRYIRDIRTNERTMRGMRGSTSGTIVTGVVRPNTPKIREKKNSTTTMGSKIIKGIHFPG
jgi:hypothetical protein